MSLNMTVPEMNSTLPREDVLEKAREVKDFLEERGYEINYEEGTFSSDPVIEFTGEYKFIHVSVEEDGTLTLSAYSGDGYIYFPVESMEEVVNFLKNKYEEPEL